jgi:hypothetical protein
MTFWKRQSYGESENIMCCQRLKRDEQAENKDFGEQ